MSLYLYLLNTVWPIKIGSEVIFYIFLFENTVAGSIANNIVIGVYCRCLVILSQIAFSSVANNLLKKAF